ncbi:MAG: hypothetical protein ABJB12_03035 [Pseudomonadota bacterium]
MTDALPSPTSSSTSGSEPELEVNPPPGVQLEYPAAGGIRVQVQIPLGARLLLRVPRALLLGLVVTVLIQAWRHRLFIVFWFFGVPFLRWLRGPGQNALLIADRELVVEGASWFGGTRSLPRFGIDSVSMGRAGALYLFQRALVVQDKDQHRTLLLVGASQEQAGFVLSGLQRWLAGEG